MTNPMQSDPDRLRLALDNGEEVELDGGTLVLGDEESPSVLLRLAPWRARSVARMLEEWSAVSRVFHRAPRPILTELELSRTLDWPHPYSVSQSQSCRCSEVVRQCQVGNG